MQNLKTLALSWPLFIAYIAHGQAGDPRELAKPALAPGASFGTAVAADSAYIAVGADLDRNETGTTVLYRDGEFSGVILRPSDVAMGGQFGCTLSAAAGILAIGAQNDGGKEVQYGSVYLFSLNDPRAPLAKLLPPTRRSGQGMGSSVALDATASALATGATSGAGVGAVHLFVRGARWEAASGTRLVEINAPSDLLPGDNFGQAVGLVATGDGAHLVAAGANHARNKSGAVLIFRVEHSAAASKVSREATLVAADAVPGAYFGSSIAMAPPAGRDGCVLMAVGAGWADGGRGAVYLFGRQASSAPGTAPSWRELKLAAPAAASSGASFGISVALSAVSGKAALRLVVGAWMDGVAGAAYTYRVAFDSMCTVSAEFVAPLKPPASIPKGAFFGSSVAQSRSGIVVGADGAFSSDGAAYVYADPSAMLVV